MATATVTHRMEPEAPLQPKQTEATTSPELPLPDFADTIRTNITELITISQYQGDISNRRVEQLIRSAGHAYTQARNEGGTAFQAAKEAHADLWAASLQANHALANVSLEQLEDIDYEEMQSCKLNRFNAEANKFNHALEAAVSAKSKLACGEHVIQYNHQQIRGRIIEHMRRALSACPNHKFPLTVDVEGMLSDND